MQQSRLDIIFCHSKIKLSDFPEKLDLVNLSKKSPNNKILEKQKS